MRPLEHRLAECGIWAASTAACALWLPTPLAIFRCSFSAIPMACGVCSHHTTRGVGLVTSLKYSLHSRGTPPDVGLVPESGAGGKVDAHAMRPSAAQSHINLWAIENDDARAIVVAGLQTTEPTVAWASCLLARPRTQGKPNICHPNASRSPLHVGLADAHVQLQAVDYPAGISDLPHAGCRYRLRGAGGWSAMILLCRLGRGRN